MTPFQLVTRLGYLLRGGNLSQPVSTAAFVLALALIFGVEAVRSLFVDLPGVGRRVLIEDPVEAGMGALFWSHVATLAVSYWLAWGLTRPEVPDAPSSERPHWAVARLRIALERVLAILLRPPRWARVAAGLSLVFVGGALFTSRASDLLLARSSLSWSWAGCAIGTAGAWLALAQTQGARAPARTRAGELTWVTAASLAALGASYLLGEFWWRVAYELERSISWGLYTLWGLFHLCLILLAVGRFCDSAARSAIGRLGWTAAVVLTAAGSWAQFQVQFGAPDAEGAALSSGETAEPAPSARPHRLERVADRAPDLDWYEAARARLASMPPGEPVLIVAAAGGGTRAALHTALVLEALERTPAGGGVDKTARAPIGGGGSLADRILFISGVSGGSAGLAHFALGETAPAEGAATAMKNTLSADLERAFYDELDRLCAEAPAACGLRERNDSPLGWPLSSQRFNALSVDLYAPFIRGILLPGVGRSESMNDFFRSQFGWDAAPSMTGDGPLLLIGAADLERGTRLTLGVPRLPAGLRRIRSLGDLGPDLSMDVEQAVVISASVPGLIDPIQVGSADEGEDGHTLAVDGGVVDNTGLDMLSALFASLAARSSPDAGGVPPTERAAAAALLDELAQRGVLLLEIDSGVQPRAPRGRVARWAPHLTGSVYSLFTASYARARASVRTHNIEIRESLGEREGARVCVDRRERSGGCFDHVSYQLDSQDLVTSVALNPTHKGVLMARFLAEDTKKRKRLARVYEDLRAPEPAAVAETELGEPTL